MKPRCADLFCGAGGAAMGLHRAGFEVVGFDIKPQKNYPFEFHQADALTVDLSSFRAAWASPPCQRYSAGAKKWGTSDNHPDLIAPARDLLLASGLPYIIENIEPAAPLLRDPGMLCGTMFDLGVFRHRCFESNVVLLFPEHTQHSGRVGDGKYHTVTGHAGGSSKRDGWKGGSTSDWRIAMGIDWMTGNEMAESIPPAYSEFLGRQLIKLL
jgi:DNA (cytosine-5)-methyltransferase 1